MYIKGVGELTSGDGYWECSPPALEGSLLSIESTEISEDHLQWARYICSNWTEILAESKAYIELRRGDYQLEATQFKNPNVFLSSGEVWSVYFDTESELEAIVGVEFRGRSPFQLVVGD